VLGFSTNFETAPTISDPNCGVPSHLYLDDVAAVNSHTGPIKEVDTMVRIDGIIILDSIGYAAGKSDLSR
jgi:hypothetical protein